MQMWEPLTQHTSLLQNWWVSPKSGMSTGSAELMHIHMYETPPCKRQSSKHRSVPREERGPDNRVGLRTKTTLLMYPVIQLWSSDTNHQCLFRVYFKLISSPLIKFIFQPTNGISGSCFQSWSEFNPVAWSTCHSHNLRKWARWALNKIPWAESQAWPTVLSWHFKQLAPERVGC